MTRFRGRNVKGQGHDETNYGQKSLVKNASLRRRRTVVDHLVHDDDDDDDDDDEKERGDAAMLGSSTLLVPSTCRQLSATARFLWLERRRETVCYHVQRPPPHY